MDDAPLEFDAVIEPVAWGSSVYTILEVPAELHEAARRAGTHRVQGHLDDEPVNLSINQAAEIGRPFLYCGKPLQRRLGLGAGDVVTCRLAPVDPDHVPVADDVRGALLDAGRLDAWERLSPPQRRRLLQPVESAGRPATRARRVADLVRGLPTD